MWRVELVASAFLSVFLCYLLFKRRTDVFFSLYDEELKFIVYPILALIFYGLLSAVWAASWKSAVHHSLVWSEYLIFFLIVRHLIAQAEGFKALTITITIALVALSVPVIAEYCSFLIFGGANLLGIKHAKYGEQVNTIIPLIFVGIVRLNGRRFWLGVLAVAVMWLLIFCSLGRINFFLFCLGITATAFLIFFFKRYRRYRLKAVFICGAILIAPFLLHISSLFSANAEIPIINRVTDEAGISSSNNFRKLGAAVAIEMTSENPVFGIGADSFGFEFNRYRAAVASKHPDEPFLAEAENEIPERAHNELLQVSAELGIFGVLIVLWFISGIAIMAWRSLFSLGRIPLEIPAAVIGLVMFLASSLVSSYSFRLVQNGFVFFFVLAVASKQLLRSSSARNRDESNRELPIRPRLIFVTGIFACLGLLFFSALRVSSVIVSRQAESNPDISVAAGVYDTAMKLDDENPEVRRNFGMRLFREKRFEDAIPYLEEAIRIGSAPSPDFSYLATAYSLSGKNAGAEKTMARAVELYPRSVFVLTRYASLLNTSGNFGKSQAILERAYSINKPAANTWLTFINSGAREASSQAYKSSDYTQVMDLQPQSAIYAVLAEREIRFPEEKIKISINQPGSN